MKLITRVAALALTLVAVAGLACTAAEATEDAATAPVPATGAVRVVHLSPDAPPVDILVDGQPALTGLAFPAASEYAALPAATYAVAVTPAGANDQIVLETQLPVTADTDATVVAVGRLAALELLVLPDDNAAPAPGMAKVRVVHASPDAPAVDIAVAGGPVLFPNVAFKEHAGYAAVPAGAYDLEVRVAGTDTVALSLPGVSLGDGQIVTVFAAGLLADGSLTAVPVEYPAR
jgi:hypothetical protein